MNAGGVVFAKTRSPAAARRRAPCIQSESFVAFSSVALTLSAHGYTGDRESFSAFATTVSRPSLSSSPSRAAFFADQELQVK